MFTLSHEVHESVVGHQVRVHLSNVNQTLNPIDMSLYPIPSMYGIFTYIWLFLMGKYGKCS